MNVNHANKSNPAKTNPNDVRSIVIKKSIYPLLISFRLVYGGIYFLFKQRTPYASYVALRQLFCMTNGYGLDVISFLIRQFKSFRRGSVSGVSYFLNQGMGITDSRGPDFVLNEIRQNGFCVLDTPVDQLTLDKILEFALTVPGDVLGKEKTVVYNRDQPLGVRYDFKPGDILVSPIFNSLLASHFTAQVAASYLGCRPWLDVISLWWHTNYSKEPDADAAQLYHFDLDRVKWLKVFVYVTDVGPDNGPHCFIEGSHKSGVLPKKFLRNVYTRISDDEIFEFFSREKEKKFTGPRGTVIIEDTRGLHKGQHVLLGDRLIFQMQYSNSLFGMNYEPVSKKIINTQLLEILGKVGVQMAFR